VEDDLRPLLGEDAGDRVRVADVGAVQPHPALQRAGEIGLLAGGQVVDDGDLVAAVDEGVDEVGADEAGSAGDEGAHGAGG
jgi:hypothetical protein